MTMVVVVGVFFLSDVWNRDADERITSHEFLEVFLGVGICALRTKRQNHVSAIRSRVVHAHGHALLQRETEIGEQLPRLHDRS